MDDLNSRYQTDFYLKSTFRLAVTAATLIIPFAIYHLSYKHLGVGIGAVITALSLYIVAWACYRKKYKTIYTFIWFTPFTTLFIAYIIYFIGITGTYWCYPTLILFYFMMSERQAWLSNIIFALFNIPIVWYLFETHEAIRFTVTFSLVSAYSAIFLHIVAKQYSELQKMATTDKLTGLYNRTLLKDSLERAISQNKRSGIPFSLITFDIDHFKSINDTLGHDIGDDVLKEMANILKSHTRSSDMVFRIGGEEFVVLVHNTDEKQCADVAEKIRQVVEQERLLSDRQVTISAGISGLKEDMDIAKWLKASDEKLYLAKKNGRNRVVNCYTNLLE